MIYDLKNEYDRTKFKEYCNALYSKSAVVELKEKKAQRTSSQNRYLHLIINFFACEYGCSADDAKYEFFKRTCNRALFECTKTNKFGKEVSYMRSSSDLDTSDMTTAIERFRNWSSAEAGIYLPAPNDNEFLLYVEKEIERHKEFL